MGFKINANVILRQDINEQLEVGKEYTFKKDSSNVLADDIEIWLAKNDWTALAEIQITSQTRTQNMTSGSFVVKYLYDSEEQETLTGIFRRMYGWE